MTDIHLLGQGVLAPYTFTEITSPPTPLLQGEGSIIPPSLVGLGVRGLGFYANGIFSGCGYTDLET